MLSSSPDDSFDEDCDESIEPLLRCEDFKSKFARKLSKFYESTIANEKEDASLKYGSFNDRADNEIHVPENTELCTQLSKSNGKKNDIPMIPFVKYYKIDEDIRNTEIEVLKMEVETLRWQLGQTDENRQMHIALLKQIVNFLNRVKEHFEEENKEDLPQESSKDLTCSLKTVDSLCSRPELHVIKNEDNAITPTKKIRATQSSKSISNINGYKDRYCYGWQFKRKPIYDKSNKIFDEMTRLITLANAVFSTQLLDLTSVSQDKNNEVNVKLPINEKLKSTIILKDKRNFVKRGPVVSENNNDSDEVEIKDIISNKSNESVSYDSIILDEKFDNLSIYANGNDKIKSERVSSPNKKVSFATDKLHEYNKASNFIEDESGFSSMSSYQEIGIPVNSISPPSSGKKVDDLEEISTILEENVKFQTNISDEHSIKVFWV